MQRLDAINETSYLSVPNAPIYRKIMRLFYREYEKMHFQLYKEDVYELVKGEEEFAGQSYGMAQLEQDLDALVKWKNLTPIQDPGRVYTIADYKNRQYRYTMSEYAVEIERMTVRLENLFLESGNLSTNFFVRLEKSLEEAEGMEQAPLKEVNEWWNLLQEDFKRLNQNYQDYLRDFYSGKADRLMKSVEFVIHKDKFIKYLNEFIQELQRHSRRISQLLEKHMERMEGTILERVVQSELDIPHAVSEYRGNAEPSIRENVTGKWELLKNWFLDTPEHECEARKVLQITNDVIRSIIQNAALIVQMQNWGISRKEDYRKFLELFLKCEDLEEAQDALREYEGIWRECRETILRLQQAQERIREQQDRLEEDRQALDDALAEKQRCSGRVRECEIRIRQYEEYLNRPEIREKAERLKALNEELEQILLRDRSLLTMEDIEKVASHFRSKIRTQKRLLEESGGMINYMELVREAMDYRGWFTFQMFYRRGEEPRKPLTNAAFNRFSGGEKAMAMYVPLFAAVNAQYQKADRRDHPRIIALDEAFAGVDDKNISSMFELVEKLDFDYIMNSQSLWGCFDTVKGLRIAELLRPMNSQIVTIIRYTWNGHERILDEQ